VAPVKPAEGLALVDAELEAPPPKIVATTAMMLQTTMLRYRCIVSLFSCDDRVNGASVRRATPLLEVLPTPPPEAPE
jgi:hypothetical protein